MANRTRIKISGRKDKKRFHKIIKLDKDVEARIQRKAEEASKRHRHHQLVEEEEPSSFSLMKGAIGTSVYAMFQSLSPRGALGAAPGAYFQRRR